MRVDFIAAWRRFPARLRARVVAPAILAGMLVLASAWTSYRTAEAHAPGIATAEIDLVVREAPAADGAIVSELAAGSEMELTGDASGEYVEVATGGLAGWVDVSTIRAGQIQTATATVLTEITDAPDVDGRLLMVVPAGETVILTGAAVDQYLAASYDGTGGWLPAANLAP